jgi:hypothetical protein
MGQITGRSVVRDAAGAVVINSLPTGFADLRQFTKRMERVFLHLGDVLPPARESRTQPILKRDFRAKNEQKQEIAGVVQW